MEQGVIVTSAYHILPTSHHVPQRFNKETLAPIFRLRIHREQHVPDSSNHSLYPIKLFNSRHMTQRHTHTQEDATAQKQQEEKKR